MVMALIDAIRREKAERRLPLNAAIKNLIIYAGNKEEAHILSEARDDVEGTCKAEKLEITLAKGEGKGLERYPNIHFVTEY